MEVKFATLLNELGVQAEATTKKIADAKVEFDEAWNLYQEALADYENADDDDEKESLKEDIESFEKELQEADDELVKKIKSWDKNKEVWAKGAAALAEKRAAKKSGGQEPTPQVAPQPNPKFSTPTPQAIPSNSQFQGDGGVVKKKEGNAIWWILAGVVGVVTLGAVVMKRE